MTNTKDRGALEGDWQLVRAEFAGESAPELVTVRTLLTFTGEYYAFRYAGEVSDRGTFNLGVSGELKTIQLCGIDGMNSGRMIPGIYQLVGNRLRICFGLDGVQPTRFTAEGRWYVASYRKQSRSL